MRNSLVEEHPWLQSNLGYTLPEQKEIVHRVDAVKRELFSAVLAAQGDALSLNGLINYVSILIQLPIICLIYNDKKALYKTFDLEKFHASRSSKIKTQSRDGVVDLRLDGNSLADKNPALFDFFGSGYCLRVFLLSPDVKGDGSFLEVPTKNLPVKKKVFSKLEKQQEYIRVLLSGFLDFSLEVSEYGEYFIAQIKEKIKNIIASNGYKPPNKGRRNLTTLTENINETKEFIEKRLENMVGEQHGLDRIYRRTSFAGRAIKSIGIDGDSPEHPNMFFSFRVYDRTASAVRAKREVGGSKFDGYMHSVGITISFQQEKDIFEYFNKISKSYNGEKYGDGWIFEPEGDDKTKKDAFKSIYKNLSLSLDQIFWTKIATDEGRKFVIKKLKSQVSRSSTSMVDAVFYYGSVIYRMPFRKLGGLSRLHKLEALVDSCIAQEKEELSIRDIEADAELYDDCLRVVAFFYLTRMLGPRNVEQEKCWTRISIFPIEVATSIVGAISCISYEKKEIDSHENLPVDNREWRQEFYFFTEIVGAAQRVLRLQYRDFQIDTLCEAFTEEFRRFLITSVIGNDGDWDENMLNAIEVRLNTASKMISRICPWPAYKFALVPLDSFVGIFKGVRIGDQFGIIIENETQWDIFRVQHDIPGFHEISMENKKSLLTKMDQRVKSALENFNASIVVNASSNEVH